MRSRRAVLLAVSLALLLFWGAVSADRSQPSGSLTVAADYELFGSSELTGGGHITWTLTGSAAQALRAKILDLFDGYTQLPRGFSNAGLAESATNGNGDGVISLAEGQAYTSAVDRYLEAQGAGNQVGYYLLRKASLFDTDPNGGFERSTTGIVNADANSTADLQIRFITEGASTVQNLVMNLSTDTYVRALEDIFSFEADQSPTLTAGGLFPGAWPLVEETNLSRPGWHIVTYDASRPALWAGEVGSCTFGNESTCTYAPNANLSAETSIDPTLVPSVPYLDLRFASQASVTFNYTGQVADAGDAMEVQIASGPAYSTWTALPNGTFSVGQNTEPGEWRSASVDLSGYLGDRVRLRLLFHSDGSGERPGFFVRDFDIHAPSTYLGPVIESDAHYLIGTLSFSGFATPSGGVTLFRTPGGEILYYSSAWQGSVPPDVVRFETFNILENPQVLFAVMVVAAYLISRLQGRAYDAYREAYPSVYRPVVRKAKNLHRLGTASILLLVLCYFVPTWPYVLGLRVYVNGPAYWFLALTLTLGLGLGTRAYYRQKLEEAPPPSAEELPAPRLSQARAPVPVAVEEPEAPAVACTQCLRPIASGERTYTCTCGAVYHATCAGTLLRCATCRKPIGLEVVPSGRAVSMRCSACGEVQTIPEGTDPRTAACAACGGSLRPLDAGKRYLLIASNPAIAFRWAADLARGGKPVLCVTASAPDRLRLEYGLKGVRFLRVSTEGADAVDPRKLDPVGLKAILPLTRGEKGGVLLYDGLDQMIATASTGDILRFLRKANDLAFVHEVTVIGRVAPGRLADAEIDRLGQEFDEVLDLSARI